VKISRLTVKGKLIAAFGLLAAIVLVVSGVSLRALSTTAEVRSEVGGGSVDGLPGVDTAIC
jgi:hypothetical protein